ncbi:diguanylate cyclase domain-containing protein [Thioalkalivibrio sp. XN279]|uniref:diguanylate cyclase domain-containing protein n=1 Tax=Thioalkalivibrio sp. XN279 TaxID=2714953 RepID=UPI00140B2686|nr:diguanylate cyclase [Thioalkalivibrio sp. XN279]NHA15241.1 diguanylate cyclase [Thioalkalivibrio sp. XN279]
MSGRPATGALPAGLALPALEHAGEGVAVLAADGARASMQWLNPAFARMTGFGRAELAGNALWVICGTDREQPGLAELQAAVAGTDGCSALLRCYRPDGTLYWCSLRLEPVLDAADHPWWLAFARDVSAEREMAMLLGRHDARAEFAQRRLEDADTVDRLTGLQASHAFELALELAWFSCARDRRALTLFLFAPDYFDVYLETFGKVTGDSCLRMVAHAVAGAFRRTTDVSARIGDARFAAIGVDMPREVIERHAAQVCERVRALAIRNPRAPRVSNLSLSAAVIHALPAQAHDWRALLEMGRTTLAEAQEHGVEQVVVQDYGLDAEAGDATSAAGESADSD